MTDEDKTELSSKEKALILKEKLTSRSGIISLSVIFGLFLLMLLVMKACEPAKGSVLYGVCGAFLEQQIEFPEMMEHQYVEQYSSAVRIYYSQIDGFGQYLAEYIECSFSYDTQNGTQLKAVVFNTIKEITEKTPIKNKGHLYAVKQKYIDLFNQSNSIEIIINQEPDLTLPYKPVAL